MADIFDKALLVGMGIEKKAREVLEELQSAGRAETEAKAAGGEGGEGAEGEGIPPKHAAENKVVEEGVKVLRELTAAARGIKEKLESEFTDTGGKVLDRLHVPNADEVEVIKEMARVAREKVEELEKRVFELEQRSGADKKQ